jgi:hypothetical protein
MLFFIHHIPGNKINHEAKQNTRMYFVVTNFFMLEAIWTAIVSIPGKGITRPFI